jgi:uncharacterized FlaG/YvyC family protein
VGVEFNNMQISKQIQEIQTNKQEPIKVLPYEQALLNKQHTNTSNHTLQEKTVIETIEKANQKFSKDTSELNFSIHEKTKQIMVKVVSKETKEVIREIPPEKILDMVAHMCEMAGLFIDEKK